MYFLWKMKIVIVDYSFTQEVSQNKIQNKTPVYEDISDDDFVDIPCSQVPQTGNPNRGR